MVVQLINALGKGQQLETQPKLFVQPTKKII